MDPKVPDSEFGNLSFEEYSFPTDVEKELTRLQALIKTQGLSIRSKEWKKLSSLKKSLLKDPRYKFKPVSATDTRVCVAKPVLVSPAHDLTPHLKKVAERIFTWEVSSDLRPSFSGHGVVTLKCSGPLEDLRIPPNPEATWTVSKLKETFSAYCLDPAVSGTGLFESVQVLQVNVDLKEDVASVSCEVIYK